jgi:eukaryotic-like serine/threonine-protein kinase
MQLWSDYEGRTIAEVYPLKKLVRPEGRSAFFLTTNGTGTPAMVRLIETHFDESEILGRWRTVSEIKQENLVVMRKFGETTLDGTPLVYAVMEPTEITLEELLQNRTLTTEEGRQLAGALLGALTALHAKGLVHEHIEPANIVAVGETVKLRSDCVREANLAGDDAADMETRKAADAHAVALVLLEALTGRRALQGSATMLPPPFDGIIRNGLSGKWGLGEMVAALGPVSPVQVAAATSAPKPAATPVDLKKDSGSGVKAQAVVKESEAPAASLEPVKDEETEPTLFDDAETEEAEKVDPAKAAAAAKSAAYKAAAYKAAAERPLVASQAPDVRHRIVKPVEEAPRRMAMYIAAAVILLAVIFFAWRMTHSSSAAGASEATPRPAMTAPAAPAPANASAPQPAARPSAARPLAGRPAAAVAAPATGKTQWRVVAFTYNREAQAQEKADALKQQHPALNPEVFSPSGHAPYLVTVGGAMSREQAEAFKRKAHGEGLPRDVYAQNYSR